MITEEEFDGFRIAECPACKRKFKFFYHDDENYAMCPICNRTTNKYIKDIKKKVTGKRQLYSVVTEEESYFNY